MYMKTDLKEINSYTRQLNVIVEWDSIENEYNEEFNKARSRYNIPGFRKGKVPEKIVKKNLGSAIEANFAEHSLNEYYRQALEELEITPINQATINNLNFKEGLDLSFTAKFASMEGPRFLFTIFSGTFPFLNPGILYLDRALLNSSWYSFSIESHSTVTSNWRV